VQVRTSSTASAAEQLLHLSETGDPLARHSAAICSRICVDLHKGLEVLQGGIQDGDSALIILSPMEYFLHLRSSVNFTRFVVLSKAPLPSQLQPPILQRAFLRCVLPLECNISTPPMTLSAIIKLFPEDIQVVRVDRRPSSSSAPFHDCVFLEVVCHPPLVSGNASCPDIGQRWKAKITAAVDAANARTPGDHPPCCRILGAW
jgi:prephenate dehydratase